MSGSIAKDKHGAYLIRNPEQNSETMITVEAKHLALGWIPFSATPDDAEPHGRDIYLQAAHMLKKRTTF